MNLTPDHFKSADAETTDNPRILLPISSALSIPARLKRERSTRPFGGQTSASGGLLDKLKKRPLECLFRFNHR